MNLRYFVFKLYHCYISQEKINTPQFNYNIGCEMVPNFRDVKMWGKISNS